MEEVDGFFTVKLERFNLRGVKNELDRERKNAKISWRVTTKSNKKRMELRFTVSPCLVEIFITDRLEVTQQDTPEELCLWIHNYKCKVTVIPEDNSSDPTLGNIIEYMNKTVVESPPKKIKSPSSSCKKKRQLKNNSPKSPRVYDFSMLKRKDLKSNNNLERKNLFPSHDEENNKVTSTTSITGSTSATTTPRKKKECKTTAKKTPEKYLIKRINTTCTRPTSTYTTCTRPTASLMEHRNHRTNISLPLGVGKQGQGQGQELLVFTEEQAKVIEAGTSLIIFLIFRPKHTYFTLFCLIPPLLYL